MLYKSLLISCILVLLYSTGFSKTRNIRIRNENLKNTYEDISVLKSNNKVKDGSYKKITYGKTSIEGKYKNNERTGIWKVYDYKGDVETVIDYNSGLLKYLKFDSILKQEVYANSAIQPIGDRPVLSLSGSNQVLNYLIHLIIYPVDAIENNISGKVVISVKVDSEGKITDYLPYKSVDKSVDNEAIRIIKLIPLEFLPEYKNGKPVASEFKIPVYFALQN